MRIIAGSLKGRRLEAPPPGALAIRPTADRAREALFGILQARPSGAFLDLFAGTGAVGLEAWSRGHAPVVCVERDPAACALAERNARGTGVRILRQDASRLEQGAFQDQAVVFADPPYAQSPELFQRLAPVLRSFLAPGGLLIWETEQRQDLAAPEGLTRVDDRRYGAARFHFFQAG